MTYNHIDLTGRIFGRLTAVEPTDRRDYKGSVYWKCKCECGNYVQVTEDKLMRGINKSCGCLQKENRKRISERLHRVDGTCIEFIEKRKFRRDNKSGFRGVYRSKAGNYKVSIGFKGKRYYLGTYNSFTEAVNARKKAEHMLYDSFIADFRSKEKIKSK